MSVSALCRTNAPPNRKIGSNTATGIQTFGFAFIPSQKAFLEEIGAFFVRGFARTGDFLGRAAERVRNIFRDPLLIKWRRIKRSPGTCSIVNYTLTASRVLPAFPFLVRWRRVCCRSPNGDPPILLRFLMTVSSPVPVSPQPGSKRLQTRQETLGWLRLPQAKPIQ